MLNECAYIASKYSNKGLIAMIARLLSFITIISLLIIQSFTVSANTSISNTPIIQSIDDEAVPPSLRRWKKWLQVGQEHLTCPMMDGGSFGSKADHFCAWPQDLSLNIDQKSGGFFVIWQVLNDSWIPMPGNQNEWPVSVLVNGKPMPTGEIAVSSSYRQPGLWLKPGRYQVEGEFLWDKQPGNFTVPEVYGALSLMVNGDNVDWTGARAGRSLRLDTSDITQEDQTKNDLSVHVYRKVKDGPQIILETVVEVDSSGGLRQEIPGKVLPDGFSLIAVQSTIPAYVDNNGLLNIIVQESEAVVNVLARADRNNVSWKIPKQSATNQWPSQEIWALQLNPQFRQAILSGAVLLDSDDTNAPVEWSNLPHWLLEGEQSLTLSVQPVSDEDLFQNSANLSRKIWLNFDGQAFSVEDSLSGQLDNQWRLSLSDTFTLMSAENTGEYNKPILITKNDKAEQGFEVREPQLQVKALSTKEGVGFENDFDVNGWNLDMEQVEHTLILPPAWRLIATAGIQSPADSMLGQWSLWWFFIVLLMAGIAHRVWGLKAGLLTVLMMILIAHEKQSPYLVLFIGVVVLGVATLLSETLNKHPFVKGLVGLTAGVMVLMSGLFVVSQIQSVIYPQLDRTEVGTLERSSKNLARSDIVFSEFEPALAKGQQDEFEEIERIEITGSRIKSVDLYQSYDSDAGTQAGYGYLNWRWNRYNLFFGPASKEQTVQIYLLSPWQSALYKLTGIALMLIWLSVILKRFVNISGISDRFNLGASSVLVCGSLIAGMTLHSNEVNAQTIPSDQLLSEYQALLTQPPACVPDCVSLDSADISLHKDTLQLSLHVSAQTNSLLALPRSQHWRVNKVMVNGETNPFLIGKAEHLYVPIKAGVQTVMLSGFAIQATQFSLLFDELPKRMTASVVGWNMNGVAQGRILGDTVSFDRKESEHITSPGEIDAKVVSQQIEPFGRLKKTLKLDIDFGVFYSFERIAPLNGAISFRIPALSGEQLMGNSEHVTKEGDNFVVNIPAAEESVTWHTQLDRKSVITLRAATDDRWTEHWSVEANARWHVAWKGLSQFISAQEDRDNGWMSARFYPESGDALTLDIKRFDPVKGPLIAIDKATVAMTQSETRLTGELTFDYRSALGGEHWISLPPGLEVEHVHINNVKQISAVTAERGLLLQLIPGKHSVNLTFSQPNQLSLYNEYPVFDLNAPVSNIETQFSLNRDRVLLHLSGPAIGPVVLYWGQLVGFAVLAFLIGRVAWFRTVTPLNTTSLFLLGAGISINWWPGLVIILGYFVAISLYAEYRQSVEAPSVLHAKIVRLMLLLSGVGVLLMTVLFVPFSLLGTPDVTIVGNQSSMYMLNWYQDRSDGLTSTIAMYWIPVFVFKAVLMLWALWLSQRLMDWTRWSWMKLT